MSLKRNIWLAYINGIELQYNYVEYMLNYIVRAGDCQLPYDQLASICLNFYPRKSALYIIVALVFRIIVNKKKSVTYCQQVLFIVKEFCVQKVFIALFVEYPLCFLLCHNLHLHMLKTCSIGKTVFSVSCARFKSHICKLRLSPHFKTKKSLHLPLPEP